MNNIIKESAEALLALTKPAPHPANIPNKPASPGNQYTEKPVPVSTETISALAGLAKSRGVEIVTKDESAKLAAGALRWKYCQTAVNSHTDVRAKDAWLAGQQRMANRIASGEPVTDKEDGWSRKDWEQDYYEKMTAGKVGGDQVVKECVTIVQPSLARFEKFCEDFAIEQEAGEISVCESLKIPYRPSIIIQTIRSAPAAVRHLVPEVPMWGNNPEHFISWAL